MEKKKKTDLAPAAFNGLTMIFDETFNLHD